ncbi:HMA2 domain-containing protein [Gloeothece verrucosa]|uniref:Heavy metal translocating P-type ATPase n=1 Tax=Gloeothece verrucosa (strain PCC 7822) TaxID=497965 RepID=E0UCR5_GLOV7|nr:hypothetical protein [Gloeothece verrucosa]ADN15259.1 conserved hypothetical protein [Gloeothece verrucosa PCC 7822]
MEYDVVHQVPGRVRYRIPQLAHDPELVENLQFLLGREEYVTEVRIKPFASSLVVSYQTESLSAEKVQTQLENLFKIADLVFPKEVQKKP